MWEVRMKGGKDEGKDEGKEEGRYRKRYILLGIYHLFAYF